MAKNPKSVTVKNPTVADPEIAFNIQVNRSRLGQEFSGINFLLVVKQADRTYESSMHLERSAKDGAAQYDEILNDEFDIIFPFVDPNYAIGQTFHYELYMSFYDLTMKAFHEEKFVGTGSSKADHKYLDYWIADNSLQYRYEEKHFHRPEDGVLTIFDHVVGKAGLGLRVSWGADLDVWKIKLIASFEDGKAHVDVWLNKNIEYKPKFLPLTIFAPYPKGTNYKEHFQYSFRVELFDKNGQKLGFRYDTDIPWSPEQSQTS